MRVSDFRGQPVVLTFFTTWRPQCRREAPAKTTLYAEYTRHGLAMVGRSEAVTTA